MVQTYVPILWPIGILDHIWIDVVVHVNDNATVPIKSSIPMLINRMKMISRNIFGGAYLVRIVQKTSPVNALGIIFNDKSFAVGDANM